MKAHELKVDAQKGPIRPGRGISAGRGKTAGRGTKGQNSRSGGKRRPGFEGGQNPLIQRLPKLRGFTSKRTAATEVYTVKLAGIKGGVVSHVTLSEAGVIADQFTRVKVILNGEVSGKVQVELDSATKGAIAAIEAAGGSFVKTPAPMRQKKAEASKKTTK